MPPGSSTRPPWFPSTAAAKNIAPEVPQLQVLSSGAGTSERRAATSARSAETSAAKARSCASGDGRRVHTEGIGLTKEEAAEHACRSAMASGRWGIGTSSTPTRSPMQSWLVRAPRRCSGPQRLPLQHRDSHLCPTDAAVFVAQRELRDNCLCAERHCFCFTKQRKTLQNQPV